jgi:uncharacterized membrane protein
MMPAARHDSPALWTARPGALWVFLVTFALFAAPKVLEHETVRSVDWDTGIYSSVAWNVAHGNGFYSAVQRR